MKRKGLLLVTECAAARFDTLAARDQLPFLTEGGKWSDYTLDDAFKLRLMLDATEFMDVKNASRLARDADYRLPLSPLGRTGDREMWMGGLFYRWPDKLDEPPEMFTFGGRIEDLAPAAEKFMEGGKPDGFRFYGWVAVNATKAARQVREAAHEIGLPEWDKFPSPPLDLAGLPDWLAEAERLHREVVFNWPGGEPPEDVRKQIEGTE